ncbi:SurA N-terminal domain-containing protein [Rossellomorea aquimaris]|uniref:SurA N-terminal domain-containing protein n=1 Tax=Rossellomorea aquimaris TaxID=189382 RepID=UPI001CD44A9B|nr:SurA N-terminal domain-containing protein [Rossellomorea aquimaris]MCA1056689.1 SurA N-terminal domain-containing protein [Rossellomorea aquimaris]
MKKFMSALLITIMAIALVACGNGEEAKKQADDKSNTEQKADQKEQAKQMEEMQKKMDKQKVEKDKVVAIVNDEKLKGEDYNSILSSSQMQFQQMGQDPTSKKAAEQIKKQTIDSLVGQTLLMQQADEKGYKATDEEINKQLDQVKKQYKTEKEFEKAMKEAGFTMEELKKQVAENIKYTNYVEKEIKVDEVTEDEMKKVYDQYAGQQGDDQKAPKFEEVKPQIKTQLEQQKKQEQLVKHVEELKKNAKIDIKI